MLTNVLLATCSGPMKAHKCVACATEDYGDFSVAAFTNGEHSIFGRKRGGESEDAR